VNSQSSEREWKRRLGDKTRAATLIGKVFVTSLPSVEAGGRISIPV